MWLYQCKLMAMQFVLLKPFIAAVPLICMLFDYDYNARSYTLPDTSEPNNPWGGGLDWRSAKLYVLILGNISVATAFYGLLTFYYGLEKDLLWCNPWPKFLCIKGVVFMTFWQGLAIQFMASTCVCVCVCVCVSLLVFLSLAFTYCLLIPPISLTPTHHLFPQVQE